MTNKDKVLSHYPDASAEQQTDGRWLVWHISQEERDRQNWRNGYFWPVVLGRSLLGLGYSENEAWADAIKRIETKGKAQVKVKWKPFNEFDSKTWPPHGTVVWITNTKTLCLAVAEIHKGGVEWPFFEAYNTNGADRELIVDVDNATHWAFAELPDLPG